MKLVVSLVTLLLSIEIAFACPPPPTCGSELCHSPDAVVEATVVAVDATTVTLDITQAFGAATLGSITLDNTAYWPIDAGTRTIVAIAGGRIDMRFDAFLDGTCLPPDASAELVANVVLSSACNRVLNQLVNEDLEPCPSEDEGCSTTKGSDALLIVLVSVGMCLPFARSRRRSRAATP